MESENQTIYPTWEEQLNNYMTILKCFDETKSSVVKTLNGIRNRLLMTAKYSPHGEILRHITLFKQRPSESSLDTVCIVHILYYQRNESIEILIILFLELFFCFQYCLSDEIHLLEEEKYKEFIKMKEMRDIINQSALFNWWK